MHDSYPDHSLAVQRAWERFKEQSLNPLLHLGRKATGLDEVFLLDRQADEWHGPGFSQAASSPMPVDSATWDSLKDQEGTWKWHRVYHGNPGGRMLASEGAEWLAIRKIQSVYLELFLVVFAAEKAQLTEEKLLELAKISDQLETILGQESWFLPPLTGGNGFFGNYSGGR